MNLTAIPLIDGDSAKSVAAALADVRKERGFSQSELAAKLGCSVYTIRSVEQGKHQPGIGVLAKHAAALGVDLVVYITQKGQPFC